MLLQGRVLVVLNTRYSLDAARHKFIAQDDILFEELYEGVSERRLRKVCVFGMSFTILLSPQLRAGETVPLASTPSSSATPSSPTGLPLPPTGCERQMVLRTRRMHRWNSIIAIAEAQLGKEHH